MTEFIVTKDNFLQQNATTDNNGTNPNLAVTDRGGGVSLYHALCTFDVSALTVSAAGVKSAVFSLYYYSQGGALATGKSLTIYKLRRTDWEEGTKNGAAGTSNWIYYKATTEAWGTAGASNTTSDVDTSLTGTGTVGALNAWTDVDITDIVKDAITNKAGIVDIFIKFTNEDEPAETYSTLIAYSKSESVETTKRPKLDITIYTSPLPTFEQF